MLKNAFFRKKVSILLYKSHFLLFLIYRGACNFSTINQHKHHENKINHKQTSQRHHCNHIIRHKRLWESRQRRRTATTMHRHICHYGPSVLLLRTHGFATAESYLNYYWVSGQNEAFFGQNLLSIYPKGTEDLPENRHGVAGCIQYAVSDSLRSVMKVSWRNVPIFFDESKKISIFVRNLWDNWTRLKLNQYE